MDRFNELGNLVVLGNSLKDYLQSFILFLSLLWVLVIVKRILIKHLTNIARKTKNDFDDFIVSIVSKIGLPLFTAVSLYLASIPLELIQPARDLIRYALVIILTVRAVQLLQEIFRYSINIVYRKRLKSDDPSLEFMVRSTSGIVKWVLWVVASIFLLDNLGINISTFVAGLGIGGVAVAMASQAILGDAFSALSIFLDKPFEVGDFIIIDTHMGTVENIGIKTTRIRSLSGEQLIFSNSDLTSSRVRNYKRMNTRRIVFKLGVVYQTSSDKLKSIPELIKTMFKNVSGVHLDRVHFQGFGNFSLDYEIVYYVHSADYNIYMDKQQEINFCIFDTFEREGIEFAYPSQTLFVKQES